MIKVSDPQASGQKKKSVAKRFIALKYNEYSQNMCKFRQHCDYLAYLIWTLVVEFQKNQFKTLIHWIKVLQTKNDVLPQCSSTNI